ncbi:hypothetical protein F750_0664 [Streptomyces sp. PAMC 26508]|nr:hypothetical protein F750_0664 [Streptomyces sp. PAMC 26508]
MNILSPMDVYVNIGPLKHSASMMSGVSIRPGPCSTPEQQEYP